MSWLRFLLLCSVVTLAVAGCSSGDSPEEDVQSSVATPERPADGTGFVTPRTMPDGKGSDAPDGVFPRTVTHFGGTSTIEAPPEKVVVISTGQVDALLTLGIVPAGATKGEGAELVPAYLTAAFAGQEQALTAVQDVGLRTDPNLEKIATLEPDLILVNTAGNKIDQLYPSLDAIAPTVVTQGTGLYWKQDFLLLGDAVGKREAAQQWLDQYHADAADFGETTPGDATVSLLRRNGDRTRVFGIASFSGSVAEDSGLARPASQVFTDRTSQDLSDEELIAADGGWIFYGVQAQSDAALTSMPLWPSLSAVQSGHVTRVDDDAFYLNVGPTAAREILEKFQEVLK